MTENEDVRAGTFGHYARIVRRRRLTVLVVLGAALLAAALVTFSQASTYQAQSKIVVGQGNALFQVQNGNSFQPFTATMADLITSNVVAQRVSSSLGLHESPTTLLSKVSVAINPQTAVMTLSVTDDSARRAQQINAAFGGAFALLVQERFGQASGSRSPPISATVFDPAHVLPGRVSPAPARNLLIAAILGLLLGIVAAFLRDHADPTLRSDEELEAAFGAPVLGRIPATSRARGRARIVGRFRATVDGSVQNGRPGPTQVQPRPTTEPETPDDDVWDYGSAAVEAYRVTRATLRSQAGEHALRRLLVSSVAPRCDKEAVAANLALAFAHTGARTLLVEADLERALLDQSIAHDTVGLAGVLSGDGVLTEAIESRVAPLVARRRGPGQLDFLPAGAAFGRVADLIAGERMAALIDDATSTYEYLLFDAPPLLGSADALELARSVDAVILVARRDETRRDHAADVRSLLDRLGIHLAGLVITDAGAGSRARRRALRPVPAQAGTAASQATVGGGT